MDFFTLFQKRSMCRCYKPCEIPEAHLQKVLTAAVRTPSAGHAQGIRVGVVRSESSRRKIADFAGEQKYLHRGFPAWLSSAPVHLLVGVSEGAYADRYSEADKFSGPESWPVPYQVLDAGKSLMTLYLAAESLGLSCGYLGPHALVGMEALVKWPKDWRFMGLVTLGYADRSKQRKSRSHQRGWRSLEESIHEWDSHLGDREHS